MISVNTLEHSRLNVDIVYTLAIFFIQLRSSLKGLSLNLSIKYFMANNVRNSNSFASFTHRPQH